MQACTRRKSNGADNTLAARLHDSEGATSKLTPSLTIRVAAHL
jgi:hypothetical protein